MWKKVVFYLWYFSKLLLYGLIEYCVNIYFCESGYFIVYCYVYMYMWFKNVIYYEIILNLDCILSMGILNILFNKKKKDRFRIWLNFNSLYEFYFLKWCGICVIIIVL